MNGIEPSVPQLCLRGVLQPKEAKPRLVKPRTKVKSHEGELRVTHSLLREKIQEARGISAGINQSNLVGASQVSEQFISKLLI